MVPFFKVAYIFLIKKYTHENDLFIRSLRLFMFLGYSLIDRINGFDLDGAKFVIKRLAELHAVPIALKFKNPELFENRVKKHCQIFAFPAFSADMKERAKNPPEWLEYVAQQEKCKPYFELLCKLLGEIVQGNFFERPHAEPFATFAHCDFWVNNTMHIIKDGKLIKSKFIDFQMYRYGSAICDLIHFIFASCQNKVSGNHLDDLLKYYHTHFIDVLEKLGCNTIPFEYEKFLERVEIEAPAELLHTIVMAVPIQGKKGVANISVDNDDFEVQGSLTVEAKEKIAHEVYEFGKRGWIK